MHNVSKADKAAIAKALSHLPPMANTLVLVDYGKEQRVNDAKEACRLRRLRREQKGEIKS